MVPGMFIKCGWRSTHACSGSVAYLESSSRAQRPSIVVASASYVAATASSSVTISSVIEPLRSATTPESLQTVEAAGV